MIGIDLVFLPEFKIKMKNFPLEEIFLPTELSQNNSSESLAGIFAAKEAFFKAFGKKENWKEVWIEKNKEGKPRLYSALIKNNQKTDMSISHAGEYAIAVVILL